MKKDIALMQMIDIKTESFFSSWQLGDNENESDDVIQQMNDNKTGFILRSHK